MTAAGRRLSQRYADYVAAMPVEWLAAVDGGAVGEVGDRVLPLLAVLRATLWKLRP